MKERYYFKHQGDLRQRLKEAVPRDELRALHRIEPGRHFVVAARHLALTLACAWLLYRHESPWIWVPLGVLQGFNILGFIILLHDQVHRLIFVKERPRWMRFLGLLYAFPSAISATQFDIWHNDHHRELGSTVTDPKRAHLSPKMNRRWLKLLYLTPALFGIYAIAAAREARGYTAEIRRRIARERAASVALHLGIAAALVATAGWGAALRAHLLPLFIFFPPAFMLNRIGQHYAIKPDDVAGWSTLVNGNPLWRFLFLNSNHHIEHHYYPGVPLYNLPALNRLLQAFFADCGIRNRTYSDLLYGWFVKNNAAHTDWEREEAAGL
ncbi:MAG: fatty acid desaturase family protein [Planctomycetota bacterium]